MSILFSRSSHPRVSVRLTPSLLLYTIVMFIGRGGVLKNAYWGGLINGIYKYSLPHICIYTINKEFH